VRGAVFRDCHREAGPVTGAYGERPYDYGYIVSAHEITLLTTFPAHRPYSLLPGSEERWLTCNSVDAVSDCRAPLLALPSGTQRAVHPSDRS
jgi:hypothetical protein